MRRYAPLLAHTLLMSLSEEQTRPVEAFLSSPETMSLHLLYTKVYKESPHRFQNQLLALRRPQGGVRPGFSKKQCPFITFIQKKLKKFPMVF